MMLMSYLGAESRIAASLAPELSALQAAQKKAADDLATAKIRAGQQQVYPVPDDAALDAGGNGNGSSYKTRG
jgi:hypothetical protein